MRLMREHSQTIDKSLAKTLMTTLIKFDGSRIMHKHVIEMTNIASKLIMTIGNMFKNQGSHPIHYVSHQRNQEVGNKFVKKHDKGKMNIKD
ncbi:hypothetical protein CR513_61904, partial [Mucuna pruriens]